MSFIKRFIKRYRIELIIGIILALVLSKIITSTVFYVALVPSESMKNTLLIGDRVLVSKNISEIEVGKIYTFYHNDTLLIKRLIAVPGDHVKIDGDDVYINNKKLDEPYVSSSMDDDKKIKLDIIVPEDKYFFLGDNRNNSLDARYWDEPFIDKDNIDGRAVRIIMPSHRKGILN